ncbi:MAG TPA: peptidoglycan DD-metalloendopeptidase family protein [Gammaproteobacteria bacterium]|nr:peptidoglycan DD-metalloendopeptidase family protein [Gammaproteobacteria bacterium]
MAIAALLLCINTHALATDNAKNLLQLQTQIQNLKRDLTTQQSSREQLLQSLAQAETNLGQLNSAHKKNTIALHKQKMLLSSLQQQQLQYRKSLVQQQQHIAQQIRAAYLLSQQNYLKMLLNQEDITLVNRNLTYYHYFIQQRLNLINQLNTTLNQLSINQQAIIQHTADLSTLLAEQQQQILQIKSNQQQRKEILQQLNAVLTSKYQQLNVLQANKQALETVVQKLQSQPTTSNVAFTHYQSFSQAQGKLNWPTKGKIISHFNSPIDNSELKTNGVIIAAKEGQNVYAIAPGKVIFSEWLAGYGLLLIVDHGHNFMTLYGRNASLNKAVGDHVTAGELLATVGKSGGYSQPALYFEIRKQGKPLNPEKWCGG